MMRKNGQMFKQKIRSMWVWIPRFAYRVNKSTQNFDIVFLIGTTDLYYDENGELQTAKRCKSEDEFVDTTIGYTVHPAFTDETSMNYINHNDAYNIAKALTANGNPYGFSGATDSHLMKNSEWGACAYLSKSKYGLNTIDITVNNITLENSTKSVYGVTGCTSNSTLEGATTITIETINGTTGDTANGGVYTWNQLNGVTESSTGTIYGIYDLSGGLWKRIAGYVANQNINLKEYGTSIEQA